jgi:signal peptidase II
LLDRLLYGSVVDFVDAGIGSIRWYTFNVADASISLAIVLLLALSIRPSLGAPVGSAGAGAEPDATAETEDAAAPSSGPVRTADKAADEQG